MKKYHRWKMLRHRWKTPRRLVTIVLCVMMLWVGFAWYLPADATEGDTAAGEASVTELSTAELTLDEEGSLDETLMYHSTGSNNYDNYQYSSIDLDGFSIVSFVLIPQTEIDAAGGIANWTPNTLEWTAKADANYIVAYCSDAVTSTSGSGANYDTYILDASRFTSDIQRRTLAGIIGHSYPFITYEQMQAELAAAYRNGEIAIDVSDCKKSEYMAAAQWAIWETTMLGQTFDGVSDNDTTPSTNCMHPLTAEDVGHGDDIDTTESHIIAIKDYLVDQTEPEKLKITSYHYEELVPKEDGTYDMTLYVTLNREVQSGELAEYALTVGDKTTGVQTLAAGNKEFAVTLPGLTREEVVKTKVNLTISGEHVQAYFFDSNYYQDMISGNWESYSQDLSFEVGIETTDISVTKYWTEGVDDNTPEVKVQLYANGKPYGEKITLHADNDWCYVWKNMLKKDAFGELITYEVKETPVDGYYSKLEQFDSSKTTKVQQWERADSLRADGQYLFFSLFENSAGIAVSNGALTWSEDDTRDSYAAYDLLSWNYVDMSEVEKTSANAIWLASPSENGGFYLTNIGNASSDDASAGNDSAESDSGETVTPTSKLCFVETDRYFKLSATGTEVFLDEDGYLYCVDSTGAKNYFMDIRSKGFAGSSTDRAVGTRFEVYELVEREIAKGDINFVLTNTKIVEDNSTDITVTKEWTGRDDGVYPTEVTVSLIQNGRAYGDPVTLNAQNNWSYTWERLPKVIDDVEVDYQIVEHTVLEGYESSLEKTNDDTGIQFTLTNTWIKYALPATGGVGTTPYIMAGLSILFGAGCLIYRNEKHKKECAYEKSTKNH